MKHVFRFLGSRADKGWVLRDSETHHAIKVVQIEVGESFEIMSGDGWVAEAEVLERTKKDLIFKVKSERFVEPSECPIDLFLAALKPSLIDDILPGAVELGVRRVYIFAQDRGELKKINDKVRTRWERIVDEALKQSKRTHNVQVIVSESFELALNSAKDGGESYDQRFMLDETSDQLNSTNSHAGSTALLVGSTSGLSEATRATAEKENFAAITIAKHILRSKTAVLAGLAIFGHRAL